MTLTKHLADQLAGINPVRKFDGTIEKVFDRAVGDRRVLMFKVNYVAVSVWLVKTYEVKNGRRQEAAVKSFKRLSNATKFTINWLEN